MYIYIIIIKQTIMRLFKYNGSIFNDDNLYYSTGLPNSKGFIKVVKSDYSVTFETPQSFTDLFVEL